MPKAMLFIDGTWLYSNTGRLKDLYGKPGFHVDFSKLPKVLADEIGRALGGSDVDVVRTYLFGSYPSHFDPRDEEIAQKRRDFFDMLRQEYHYDVEAFPINFRGRRVRRADRDSDDPFEPREKCVDISLATTMMFYAALPNSYDIAVAVVGDQDFKPVFQHVRRLGKRVAVASIKASCAPDLSDPRDEARVRDFDVIWLDSLLNALELRYEPHELFCEAPGHRGDRRVWTTFHPRRGQRFFCDSCRAEHARTQENQEAVGAAEADGGETVPVESDDQPPRRMAGRVAKLIADRGYGFVRGEDGYDYFFHLTDLGSGLAFDRVHEGMAMEFEVKRTPSGGRAGAARNVAASTLVSVTDEES